MRSRILHPGVFDNEILGELGSEITLLFLGLICYADREGLFEWRPDRIKVRIFPYRKVDIKKALAALLDAGFLERRGDIGLVVKFSTYQRPHKRETASKLLETFEGLPKACPRPHLGSPTIEIEIETEISTILKPQELFPGTEFVHLPPQDLEYVLAQYQQEKYPTDLFKYSIQALDAWLATDSPSARRARKSPTHKRRLLGGWVLEEAFRLLKLNGLNAKDSNLTFKQRDSRAVEDSAQRLFLESLQLEEQHNNGTIRNETSAISNGHLHGPGNLRSKGGGLPRAAQALRLPHGPKGS